MPATDVWTTEDIEALREMWPLAPPDAIDQRFPGRTRNALRKKAMHLGVKRQVSEANGIAWTAADEETLVAMWPGAAWEELRAALPGRSRNAMQNKATLMGIARRRGIDAQPRRTPTILGMKIVNHLREMAEWDSRGGLRDGFRTSDEIASMIHGDNIQVAHSCDFHAGLGLLDVACHNGWVWYRARAAA